ncbi:MAG: hypothetical protein LLF97_00050 [Planctomycetaceae bacterium]|nr:hypothetical protein [Planctomycetaceae bacterium]
MPCLNLLLDLEARHDELLARLDELDKRVEKTLAECQAFRVTTPVATSDAAAAVLPTPFQAS